MKLFGFLILSAFLLFPATTNSQKRYLFQVYNTTNGLSDNNILTIDQDKDGYMYFGTDAGLTRYDGTRFDNNVIPAISGNSAFVESVESDSNGNIVVASFMQGFFIQQPDRSFKQYLPEKPAIGKNVTKELKVISNSKILISTGISIYLFDNDSISRILYDKSNQATVTSMEYDVNGNIWFGGYNGVAVIHAGDRSFTPYFLPEMKGKYINKLLFDHDGNLLAGTIKGYYKITFDTPYDYSKGYKVNLPIPDLNNTTINNIYIDRHSNLWISTPSSGVFEINNDTITENITIDNGLPAVGVMRTFQDQEGNYWFATSSGVAKLTDFNKYSFSYNGKLLNGVSDLTKDNFGRIFLCDATGFYIIQNNIVYRKEVDGSILKTGGIKRFLITGNTLWIANYNGLYSMEMNEEIPDLRNIKIHADFKKNDISRIRCMNKDINNGIWIASDKGIYIYRDNKLITCRINNEKAAKIRPVKIISDQYGYYWFGDFSYGLYRMKLTESGNNEYVLDSVRIYKSLKPDSSFVTAWVQDMTIDHKGNMWFSSLYTGVYRLKIDRNGVAGYDLFSVKNGLSSNQVNAISEDDQNRIWFATIEGADYYDPETGTILHYNKRNALGNKVNGVLTDKSKVLLEYGEGILAIDNINNENSSVIAPGAIITGISVNGIKDSTSLLSGKRVSFSHNQNNITFDYGSVTFRNENVIQYQYMLEGLNDRWGSFTENRNISYGNLSPGRYCFKVRTKISDSGESEHYASFPFLIIAPFYLTWWFILIVVLLFVTIAYLVYKYRMKQLQKVERLRTRIASDLHDDIGSTLSSISILSEILNNQLDNSAKSAEMISKIGANARNMLESMDDIIWAVNPSNDRFQNLGLRIHEYAIPLFESKDIKFLIHSDDALALVQLPMDVRRNIYLIAKETTNNLVKYSECSEAKIEFNEHNGFLIMTISDNGKGFTPDSPTSRNGLKNMTRRAGQINADISIISAPGNGCVVKLTLKII